MTKEMRKRSIAIFGAMKGMTAEEWEEIKKYIDAVYSELKNTVKFDLTDIIAEELLKDGKNGGIKNESK